MVKLLSFLSFAFLFFSCSKPNDNIDPEDNIPPINLNISPNFNVNTTSSHHNQQSAFRLNRRYNFEEQMLGNLEGGFYHGVAYGDFDNDGDEDFLQSGSDGGSAQRPHFYRQTGGSFTQEDEFIKGGNGLTHPRKTIVADFDGNGIPDVVNFGHGIDVVPYPGENPELYLSDGVNLIYSDQLENHIGFFHSGAAGDIDSDGDIDILMNAPGGDGLYFLINDGMARFTKVTDRIDPEINSQQAQGFYEFATITCELIDINKDGYMDIIAAGHESSGEHAYILYGNSTGFYENPVILPQKSGFGIIVDIDIADLNNDDILDIILNRTGDESTFFYGGFYIQLLVGSGSETFTDQSKKIEKRTNWAYLNKGTLQEDFMPLEIDTTAHFAGGSKDQWIDWIWLRDVNEDSFVDIIEDQRYRNLTWLNDGNGNFIPEFNLENEDEPFVTLYDQ